MRREEQQTAGCAYAWDREGDSASYEGPTDVTLGALARKLAKDWAGTPSKRTCLHLSLSGFALVRCRLHLPYDRGVQYNRNLVAAGPILPGRSSYDSAFYSL